MNKAFSVSVALEPGSGPARLLVAGQVDMGVSPRLWDEMKKALSGGRSLRVVLSDVTYIDSSGIAVLVQGFKLARKLSLEFVLASPSRAVRDVLELANLTELFRIEESQ